VRRQSVLAILLLVFTACGGGETATLAAPVRSEWPAQIPAATPTTTLAATPSETRRAVATLTAENLPAGSSLVAQAVEEVEVFAAPADGQPIQHLEATTILGTPTVLSVLEGPERGWALVLLPGRPNGATGWIDVDEMLLYVVDGKLEVDLSERVLNYYESGTEVLSTSVAVGSPRNPTPTGDFFVTDNVTLADPNSPWGPHALGLSARSDTITEYNGGDGIIGIHGTDVPGSIGDAASLGCVRVPNETIARLHELIAIGTPVTISA
jgi:lipoprotein-anchoring transpeptidase ErfK/SrfK